MYIKHNHCNHRLLSILLCAWCCMVWFVSVLLLGYYLWKSVWDSWQRVGRRVGTLPLPPQAPAPATSQPRAYLKKYVYGAGDVSALDIYFMHREKYVLAHRVNNILYYVKLRP